ncbi:alpha/beta fold hydrolase [Thalassomonas viridans]|uniref:Alpha/beta fold hydrolase n=1 Tax=Thalassomonas viridans TaxID=137584 RepID=A0AAF0CDV2_9GAMM|nr:alpha/beta fold hydrolase [Thalassomonas viridans]WDE08835.1 alpha/beta fold hydrolase [Thalassomonas viridans]
MKSVVASIGILIMLISFSLHASTECNNIESEVFANGACTVIETYKSSILSASPTLAIVLHGDAPFWNPNVQYRVAQYLANNQKNVISIGMLRPGYTDDFNRQSDGERGETVGDNYDDKRVRQIGSSIEVLKEHYKAQKIVVIGHSGGAAITAKVSALFPELVNHAVIISCPCNINAWRKDMLKRNEYELFKGDLNISSPLELAKKVSVNTKVDLIVGKDDDNTKPYLTKQYYEALKKHGKNVYLQTIEGDHNIFQGKQVIATMLAAIE